MQTIQKEYKIYTFDELSQKAKDKARRDYNAGVDYDYLKHLMNDRLEELLTENNIKETGNTKLYYSLSYCQGDGVCFEGSFEWNGLYIYIKHSGHYYHENSKTITIYKRVWNEADGIETEEEQDTEAFNALYVKICKTLEKYGYECIEFEESEENFRETCEANEYTFLEDGEMFNN